MSLTQSNSDLDEKKKKKDGGYRHVLAGTPAPCASGGGAVSSTTPPQGLENQSLVRQFPSLIVCEDQPGPIQHPGEAQLMHS